MENRKRKRWWVAAIVPMSVAQSARGPTGSYVLSSLQIRVVSALSIFA